MAISKRIREIVYKKYDGHCAYCGKKIEYNELQVDHLQPKYLGGTDGENLMPSCRMCNFRKQTFSIDKFREELRKQVANEMQRFQARQSADYGLIEYHDHPIVFYFERCCENCIFFRRLNPSEGTCGRQIGRFDIKNICEYYRAY